MVNRSGFKAEDVAFRDVGERRFVEELKPLRGFCRGILRFTPFGRSACDQAVFAKGLFVEENGRAEIQ